jgi:hypothetical protein
MTTITKDPDKFDPKTKEILEYIKGVIQNPEEFDKHGNMYGILLNIRITRGSKLINLENIQKYCSQLISNNDLVEIGKLKEWITEIGNLEGELDRMKESGKISDEEKNDIIALIGTIDIKLIRELKIPNEFKEKLPGPLMA